MRLARRVQPPAIVQARIVLERKARVGLRLPLAHRRRRKTKGRAVQALRRRDLILAPPAGAEQDVDDPGRRRRQGRADHHLVAGIDVGEVRVGAIAKELRRHVFLPRFGHAAKHGHLFVARPIDAQVHAIIGGHSFARGGEVQSIRHRGSRRVGLREQLHHLGRNRVEHRRRNLVPRKRSADKPRSGRIGHRAERIEDRRQNAGRVARFGEVPATLQRRGHVGDRRARVTFAAALIGGEEEQLFLFPDRTGERAAELVALEARPLDTGPVIGPSIGVQIVVAQEVVHRTVERVGPALGDHIHRAAVGLAELRVELVTLNVHFLHGVHRRRSNQPAPVNSRCRHAVDQRQPRLPTAAVHRKAVVVLVLRGLGDTRAHGDDARVHVNKLERVARVGRQVQHRLLVQRHRAVGRLGIEQRNRRRHFHRLVHFTELHGEIQFQRLVHAQSGACLDTLPEAAAFDADFIGARRQLRKHEQSVEAGGYLTAVSGGFIPRANIRAGNRCGIGVSHNAGNGSGKRLRQKQGQSED